MKQQIKIGAADEQPYRWAEAWETYQRKLERCEPVASTWNLSRRLKLVTGMVEHYRKHQQPDGAICDPYSGQERYYSTPSYALAAAVLVEHGQTEWLESAASALTCSLAALVQQRAPDGHPDFFPAMIMGAYRILKPLLPEQAVCWQQQLQQIKPEETYVFTMSKMNNPNRMINWNAIMLSGEYMRYAEGLGGEDTGWIDTYVQRYHLPRFTSLGLYQDGPLNMPNCPFAYDIATRYHLTLMLLAGYTGTVAERVYHVLQRGAQSSLMMLSPLGELPTRGRSSQHQWNEATAALIFTVQAVREAEQGAGASKLAGAFRHAADLAWEAIERWQTAAGDLHIVRNYYEPEQRHGYEMYTNHTCYNLWTAAALAYAIHYGDKLDEIEAYPTPAQCTSYNLSTDGWFETVFSGVPDQQLVWHTALNDPYHIPGLSRIHRTGIPGLIGPSAAGYRDQGFTRFAEGTVFPLIHAPAWQTMDGTWHQLADGIRTSMPFDCDAGVDPADGGGCYHITEMEQTEQMTRLGLEWSGPLPAGVRRIRAYYEQCLGIIRVSYHMMDTGEADIRQLGAWIPLFSYDGQQAATMELLGGVEWPERVQIAEQPYQAEWSGHIHIERIGNTEQMDKAKRSEQANRETAKSGAKHDHHDRVRDRAFANLEQVYFAAQHTAEFELPERADMSIDAIRLRYRKGMLDVNRLTPESTFTFPAEARHVASRNGLLTGVRLESGAESKLTISYEIRLGESDAVG